MRRFMAVLVMLAVVMAAWVPAFAESIVEDTAESLYLRAAAQVNPHAGDTTNFARASYQHEQFQGAGDAGSGDAGAGDAGAGATGTGGGGGATGGNGEGCDGPK